MRFITKATPIGYISISISITGKRRLSESVKPDLYKNLILNNVQCEKSVN